MPTYPNVFSLTTGREYYGPALRDPRDQSDIWSNRPPSNFYSEAYPVSKTLLAGGVAAGIFATGFIPYKGGRLWDKYVGLMRGVEEYSPGGILRTFQLSTWFSQFTSQARTAFSVAPEFLRSEKGIGYSTYLSKLIGEAPGKEAVHQRILREGVTLREGKLYYGNGVDVALEYASSLVSPSSTKIADVAGETLFVSGRHYGSAYARSLGTKLRTHMGIPASDARLFGELIEDVSGQYHRQIIGGKNWFQYAGRQAAAWGTEWISRFNRLLEFPFEMQPLSTVFGKMQNVLRKNLGTELKFAVPYESGLKMLGNLSFKYGLILPAIGLGYQTLDYLTRESDILDKTILSEGTTVAAASIWTRTNVLASKIAEATGLHKYREAQEEIAPGSTSLSRLLAFPIMGGLAAPGIGYGIQIAKMIKLQREGLTVGAARLKASEELASWGTEGILGKIGKRVSEYKLFGKMTPTKFFGVLGATIGTALITPFIPGALIPSTRPEELEKIYSGEQEVPIRKGRWWEFGRYAWEGDRIMYYRPHWYPRLRARARERAIWGEEEPSPVEKWWKREFTYELEKKHYYDRPVPISSLPFEDVPLIGPLLAGTIGRLIKPPVLMHTGEWLGEEGVKAMPSRFGETRATEIGELPPPVPTSPYDTKGIIGEQAYRFSEMIGLPGFAMTSIKESLTGTPDLFDQTMQLESARRSYGFERSYWDLELGGMLGSNEFFRRLYPHRRRQILLYNPIENLMPSWMPGPGEKSEDFLIGDPFTKIPEGELRLPGSGYATRYPELEGVAPEDYPLIHRYKILSDIAPYSDKFKLILQQIRAARKLNTWTEYEENIYKTTQEQLREKKTRREFEEYQYLSPTGEIFGESKTYAEESTGLMARLNEMKAAAKAEPGIFTKLFGGYWELLSHNAETALDTMTPISPGAKLVHTRTALEDYKTSKVYGTENAFWSHPVRDFLRPLMTKLSVDAGFEGIPSHIKDKRSLIEYFDILEYVKNARLANLARMSGDVQAAQEFENKKNETMFGVNPFTYNYSNILRALPRSERDYFNAFAEVDSMEERAKILELVPENEKALYIARWKLQFKKDIEKAKKAEILSDEQIEEADSIIKQIDTEISTEGFPTSKDLFAEYVSTKMPGENYGDWYRRTKILPNIPLPGPDYVGFHPSVDLEDIKLKLVQSIGADMHEYDLWPSRAQGLINKPYLEEALQPFVNPEQLSQEETIRRVGDILLANKVKPEIFLNTTWGSLPKNSIEIEQDVNIDEAISRLV